jgi:ribonucleoside-diphosphate reductase alpha chain
VQKVFGTALDIPPVWHIRMQAAFQRFTDNAVSKTVNFPEDATPDDVREVYLLAYKEGCKGCTIYRYGSRDAQVLNVSGKDKKAADDNSKTVRGPRARPNRTHGSTERVNTGCGNLYVTINEDEDGLCEVFTAMGPGADCPIATRSSISSSTIHFNSFTNRFCIKGTMTYPPPIVKALKVKVERNRVQ